MEFLATIILSLTFISILGMVIAFSPTLVITELAILTRSRNSGTQSVAFITGIALAVTVFCLAAFAIVDIHNPFTAPSRNHALISLPVVDILIGVLLLVISYRTINSQLGAASKPSKIRPEALLTTKTLFWFGFIKMATSLSSITAILLAARYIMTSVNTETLRIVSALWLIAVAILPFILILLLSLYRPASFAKIQNASNKATGANWRRIIALMLAVAGCCFVIIGVLGLN